MRLTGSGVGAGLGGAICLAFGLFAGYSVFIGVGLAGLAAVVVALMAVAPRPRLTASRSVEPARVTVGQTAHGRLLITNTGRLPALGFDALDSVDGVPLRVSVPMLRPGVPGELAYPVPTVQRGLIKLGPVTLQRRDPLGLATRSAPLTGAGWLWVHPKIHATQALPVGLTLDFDGRLAERAGSTAFSSLREYRPGDDPRAVHWRSTARLGTLVVRERVDTREPTVNVLVDNRSNGFTGESLDEGVEFAASVCHAFRRAGRPVTLSAVVEDSAAVAEAGGHDLIDRLAALRLSGDADTSAVLTLVDQAGSGGLLIVVTGDTPDAFASAVATRKRRFSGVVVAHFGSGREDALHRRSGVVVITASRAEDAAALFSRLSRGRLE
jgi:uncharacterized protein (DUF58 family)